MKKPSQDIAEYLLSEFTDYITQRDVVTKLIDVARDADMCSKARTLEEVTTIAMNLNASVAALKATDNAKWCQGLF